MVLHDYHCGSCDRAFEAMQPWNVREAPCPDCAAPSPRVYRKAPAAHDDTLTGGARWMHNLGDQPVWVETKTQLDRELSSRGLRRAERKTYNKDDSSPYATPTRLKPGRRDPFVTPAQRTP